MLGLGHLLTLTPCSPLVPVGSGFALAPVLNLHPEPKSLQFPGRAGAQEKLRAENIQSTGQEDEGITAAGQAGSPGYLLKGGHLGSPELPGYKAILPRRASLSSVLPKTRLWAYSRAKRS